MSACHHHDGARFTLRELAMIASAKERAWPKPPIDRGAKIAGIGTVSMVMPSLSGAYTYYVDGRALSLQQLLDQRAALYGSIQPRPTDTSNRVPPLALLPPPAVKLEIPQTSPLTIAATKLHSRAGIVMGALWLTGDICAFRIYAPDGLMTGVIEAVKDVWGSAVVSRTGERIRVTVPRDKLTERREQLRGRLASVAIAKAA